MHHSCCKEDKQTTKNGTGGNIGKKIKIRTHFSKIIVNPSGEPYYSILYFDPADKTYHIGFSSYKLSFVREWLKNEFEVYDGPAGDVDPVAHGRWKYHKYVNKYECMECGHFVKAGADRNYCPNCGAKMDLPHEKEEED